MITPESKGAFIYVPFDNVPFDHGYEALFITLVGTLIFCDRNRVLVLFVLDRAREATKLRATSATAASWAAPLAMLAQLARAGGGAMRAAVVTSYSATTFTSPKVPLARTTTEYRSPR